MKNAETFKKSVSKINFRLLPLYIIFAAAMIVFLIKLVNIQITGADYYRSASSVTHTRRIVTEPVRGEIFDRNGVPLVTNEYSQALMLDYDALPSRPSEKNAAIAKLSRILQKNGCDINTVMPALGTYPHVAYDDEAMKDPYVRNRFTRFLKRYGLDTEITCIELYETLFGRLGLLDDSGEHIYDSNTEDMIIRVLYTLDVYDFAPDNPFVLVSEADLKLITEILEANCRGAYVKKLFKRVYHYPEAASNIIGRVGKIPSEKMDLYLAKGYSYDATVGLDGVEAAFEDILRGEEGVTVITEDEYGNITDSRTEKEAVPGKNVYLTIDIELQQTALASLEAQIKRIVDEAVRSGEPDSGEKADSGALSVVSLKGEVLALATYPTYDITRLGENYAEYAADPRKPLFDRSLFGNYQPGSTFKIATSVAGIESGTITPDTVIDDKGKYTFYEDYQPSCWYVRGHGKLNLEEAIGKSCNYYFFEVGRLTGIDTMNRYCSALGLGRHTGIELPETEGVLAGPEYAATVGDVWVPGDTLQAAIGQSKNAFSPLQLSCCVSTVLNGGSRYKATILYKTCNYSGSDEQKNNPVIIDGIDISEQTVAAVKRGMKNSKEWTSDTKNYKFDVGTKTGTAQTTKTNNNAVLVAFAPYDNPEYTIACVIENGAKGGNAARPVYDVISHIYGLDANGRPNK